jgi:hypothetical protein
MKKDIVVYTAIGAGYDSLKPVPAGWLGEVEFVAFLDSPRTAPGWDVRPLHAEFDDPCRNAKIHKILPDKYFPEARYSLWIDGSIVIKSPIPARQLFEEQLKDHDLALFRHRRRRCVYDEAAICLERAKDAAHLIERQIAKYRTEGYPAQNGLAECCVLLRRHTEQIRLFGEAWYEEIRTQSRRDQLSFNYVCRKLGLTYKELPGLISRNDHFVREPHAGVAVESRNSQIAGDSLRGSVAGLASAARPC